MKDERKTKKALIEELEILRRRVSALERSTSLSARDAKHEEATRAELEEYRTIFNLAASAIAHVSLEGLFLKVNPFWQEWLGYTESELIGRKVTDLTHPDDIAEDIDAFRGLLKGTANVLEREKRYTKKNGEVAWGSVRSVVHRSSSGVQEYLVAVVQDITDRKSAEQALREREARTSNILRSMPVGIGLARNRVITGASNGLSQMLGYTRDELIGTSTRDYFASDWDFEQIGNLYQLPKDAENATVEVQLRRKNGSRIDVVGSVSMLDDEDPNSEAIFAAIDITERKRLERELHDAQRHYRQFIESSSDAVTYWRAADGFRTDLPLEEQISKMYEGVCVDLNRAALKRGGLANKKEAVGKTFYELSGGRDMDGLYRSFIENGYQLAAEEMHSSYPNVGDVYSLETWYGAVENGQLTHLWASSMDITALKLKEQELKDSEEKFSKAFFSSPDIVALTVFTTGEIVEVNAGLERVLGYTRDEAVGRTAKELGTWRYPDDRDRVVSRISEHGAIRDAEVEFLTKAGEIVTCLFAGELIEIKGKHHVLSVARDITEKKRAEEALRQKDYIIESASSAIANSNLDGKLTYVNPTFLQWWGMNSADECLGENFTDYWILPTDVEVILEQLRVGGIWTGETLAQRPDGSTFDVQTSAALVRNGEDKAVGFMSSSVDITDRKKAERGLRESERKFRTMYDQSVQLMGFLDTDGILIDANRTALEQYGIERETVIGEPFWKTPWFSHSEELTQRTRQAVEDANAGEIVYLDVIHYDPSGKLHDVELVVAPIKEDDGTIVNLFAFGHDVTERKQAEAEVLEIGNRERQRIGQDLHDGLGQQLTGMGFLARALEQKLTSKGLPEAEEAAAMQQRITESLQQTRFLARGLVQLQLDKEGLIAALEELADQAASMFRINCEALIDPMVQVQDEETGFHLHQIAREATTNAARHGRPKNVTIKLFKEGDGVVLSVSDDGVGIEEGRLRSEGLGTRIMRYRSSVIGANLDIERLPEGGTVVRCTTTKPIQ